ncbi:hypothetical protein TrCOL_g8118 [Triparma columacea]|uniref:Phosphatidate cytidylyltransferase n=1 Tax=Triparma columacea TaxID=722753 RepID=A0A9W7FYA0_9STRA|nr:hypothetical protein TrCOL_g8118 [Triparma columacea]
MNMYEYIKINCRQCPGSLLWKVVIITAVRLTSLVPVRGGDGTYDFSYTFAEVNLNAAVLVVSLTTLVTLLPSSLSSQAFLPARTARTAALTALDFLTITLTYQAMLMIPTSSLKIYTAASAYMIDTAGLLVGRKLGGRFVDRGDWLRGVSPNKSWEGYAAGLVVSCLMASFFVPGVEVDRPGPEVYVPFALLSFLASTLGDLYNSKCKRLANVKDTGTTMGAFGGVWDRMDSVMGNSLVVAAYLTIK